MFGSQTGADAAKSNSWPLGLSLPCCLIGEKVGVGGGSDSVPIFIGTCGDRLSLSMAATNRLRFLLILTGQVSLEFLSFLGIVSLMHVEYEFSWVDGLNKPLQLSVI